MEKSDDNDDENVTDASQEDGDDDKDSSTNSSLPQRSATQTTTNNDDPKDDDDDDDEIKIRQEEEENEDDIEFGESTIVTMNEIMESDATLEETSTQLLSSGEGDDDDDDDDDDKSYDFNDCLKQQPKDHDEDEKKGAKKKTWQEDADASIELDRSAAQVSKNSDSGWSLHPEEGLPTRYEPPLDDSRKEIADMLNESLTDGLLPDPEDLLLAVQRGTPGLSVGETSDDNAEGINDDDGDGEGMNNNRSDVYEITNVMETIHEEKRARRLFIRGMGSLGSCVLPTKREFYIHFLMICLFLASLSVIIGLRQFVIWEEGDTGSAYSPPNAPLLGGEGGGGGAGVDEGLNYGKYFFVSVTFVHKIHGYDLETMDLKQIHKFEKIISGYTDLYAEESLNQPGEDDERTNLKNSTAAETVTTPKVSARCVLNNQVLSSWERKRKHQQDENDTTRRGGRKRQRRIFNLYGVANSLELDFTMEFSSHVEIEDEHYPKKFQQYINGEEGKAKLQLDLYSMGINVEEFGVLYAKGEEPIEPHPSVFEKQP